MVASPDLLTTRSTRIKQARRLATRAFRRKTGQFLVEGPQAVREALGQLGVVQEIYAELAVQDRHPEIRDLARAARVPWHHADVHALDLLTDTVTSQGVVAVCRLVDATLEEALGPDPRLLTVGVQVRDPGNAGTLVRCADAAGADAVVFSEESVDPHNPKAVRASVGSLFHLPVATNVDIVSAIADWRERGIQVLAADSYGDLDLDDCIASGMLAEPTAWLFGNEAHGLPDAVCARADHVVRVPIYGRAESLNLATAAAVCLYASARAHHHPRPEPAA
jgi:RNA methyltransferase, TrmH family